MSRELEDYFKNMFTNIGRNIVLDDDQIKAIINDDKYTLVLAGAGTGKTTTMVGKVKYLVDIKKVDPSKILVISYTKKAVQELETIIVDEFGINTNVKTFHSLAYKYIRNMFNKRICEIVDHNKRENIFYDYINILFKQRRIKDLLETFNKDTLKNNFFFYGKYFEENYFMYDSYDEFFKKYKNYKIEEANKIGIKKVVDDWVTKKLNSEYIITIKGELVKSVSEAIIANFLFKHGIEYNYEKVYTEVVEDRRPYKPDFTLDLAGKNVYIEYFGLDDEKYNRIKQKKIELHKNYNDKFIYIENAKLEDIERILDFELRKMGFIYRDRTDIEIYNQILDNNKLSPIFKLKNLFYKSIEQIKANVNRDNYYGIIKKYIDTLSMEERKQCEKEFYFINEFYNFYSNNLYGSQIYYFDYSDLLYYSNKYILEKGFFNDMKYEYIIIDEYQDISDGEYLLAKKTTVKNDAKVFAVGDDWQSIYSFRGSNIDYITRFNSYFEYPTVLSIKNTYRNSQELIDITGKFIKENKDQINKNLVSFKHNNKPIYFEMYDDRIYDEFGYLGTDEVKEYEKLKELIKKIHSVWPAHSILILARNNDMIDNCFKYDKDFIDDLGSKIRLSYLDNLQMDGMTIHKAKGLTYDEVIIIGMNNKFPRDIYNSYWMIELFKPKLKKESIEFAEERRIFYVALTRTKNNVFILTNRNAKNRSRFVDELANKYNEIMSN